MREKGMEGLVYAGGVRVMDHVMRTHDSLVACFRGRNSEGICSCEG